jgi:hypothetical protein
MGIDIFKNKDIPLYMVDIPYGLNKTHREYFTRIPWGEYKRIRFAERVGSLDTHELKFKIFKDYTIRNPGWEDFQIDDLPAGVMETVSDLIMYISDSGIIPDSDGNIDIPGFSTRLNMYRAISSANVEYQMYTMICVVFRAYTFEMLDKLPFDRIASLFASAERYLLENGLIKSPLEVYDPTKQDSESEPAVKTNVKSDSEEGSMLKELIRQQKKIEEMEAIKPTSPAPSPKSQKVTEEEIMNTFKKTLSPDLYIPPKDEVTVANGVQMRVPGIKINKQNKTGGFEESDFSGPLMTDDEALAKQMEMGLMPAGYEIILARRAQEEKLKKAQEPKIPFGKKHFKRK